MGPAGGEPLLDCLEGNVQVDDRVHTVDPVQGLRLGHGPGKTWGRETPRGNETHTHTETETERDVIPGRPLYMDIHLEMFHYLIEKQVTFW